jgi:serine protease AprX
VGPTLAAASAHAAGAAETSGDLVSYPECRIVATPGYPSAQDVRNDVVDNGASLYGSAKAMGAPTYYASGYYGQGVDVALIDSGVQPVKGLDGDNVVHGPDLSFEGQGANAHLDTFGHGTHLAGIVSGRDGDAPANVEAGKPVSNFSWAPTNAQNTSVNFRGIAPLARTVSVKVADAGGATDVTQVIAAIDWVVRHKADNGLNIRVINLSYGLKADDEWTQDALSYAVEQAWRAGVVVIASAGNDGRWGVNGASDARRDAAAGLSSPAYNKDVVAVGAYDARTGELTDFSSTAAGRGDSRGPDVVAPGASIGSLYDPGATQEDEILDDCVEARSAGTAWKQPVTGDLRFVKGSGTSQAAAMVSGAVALMLSKNPSMQPDDVKLVLRRTADHLVGAGKRAAGQGAVNLSEAYARDGKDAPAQHNADVAMGGSIDAARGHDPETGAPNALLALQGSSVVPLAGDTGISGQPIDVLRLQRAEAAGQAWCSRPWEGSVCPDVAQPKNKVLATEVWKGGTFRLATSFERTTLVRGDAGSQLVLPVLPWLTTTDWSGRAWTSTETDDFRMTWDGRRWTGEHWDGRRWTAASWDGRRWTAENWDGRRWVSEDWAGRRWAADNWDGRRWTSATWDGRRWTATEWDGRRWTATQWDGRRWTATQWDGRRWVSDDWAGRRWVADRWM